MRIPLSPGIFSLTILPILTAAVVIVFLTMGDKPVAAQYGAVLVLSYLLGSVPWGYLALRWRHGVDIREFGSGSIGMTNVLRTGGGRVAVLVLTLDIAKGILAVVLGRTVIGSTEGEVTASPVRPGWSQLARVSPVSGRPGDTHRTGRALCNGAPGGSHRRAGLSIHYRGQPLRFAGFRPGVGHRLSGHAGAHHSRHVFQALRRYTFFWAAPS